MKIEFRGHWGKLARVKSHIYHRSGEERNFPRKLRLFLRNVPTTGCAQERENYIMRKQFRGRAAAVAGLLAVSLLATACNTIAGAGKDTSDLGKDVSHAADSSKPSGQ
jgi:predicted small secreted protein